MPRLVFIQSAIEVKLEFCVSLCGNEENERNQVTYIFL